MSSDLKPTTREERERWKASCLYRTGPNDQIILRLIADVRRLERFETALKQIAQRPGDTVYDAWKIALEAYEKAEADNVALREVLEDIVAECDDRTKDPSLGGIHVMAVRALRGKEGEGDV